MRVDRGEDLLLARAYGLARRGDEVPTTLDCRFCIASGNKGLTALVIARLIELGQLELGTSARSLLGADLPRIDAGVTVEHLLAHRSGIGDYLDEDAGHAIDDYLMPVPVQQLATTEDYVRVLDGYPSKFAPGERFAYNNSGYVVLALLAERASGSSFYDLVEQHVCAPAELRDTQFLRLDELPGRTAVGYLSADGLRTNVLHLPVRGSGDGGCYSTADDIHRLWRAMFEGRIVSSHMVLELVRPRSERYGMGFWLYPPGPAVRLEGMDAGVSFRSVHDPRTQLTHTVMSNTSAGAWPMTRRLAELLSG